MFLRLLHHAGRHWPRGGARGAVELKGLDDREFGETAYNLT